MEASTEYAGKHRKHLTESILSDVHGDSLDLAYAASKRGAVIGMAHFLMHYNWDTYSAETFISGVIEGTNLKSIYKTFGMRGVFAVVFDLTQQAAIDEISFTNKAIAARIVRNLELLEKMCGNINLKWYPSIVPMVSPRGMSGSFINYMQNLSATVEESGDDGSIYYKVAKRIMEFKAPKQMTQKEFQLLAKKLGYKYRDNTNAYYTITRMTEKNEEETWIDYFTRKAELILAFEEKADVIGHLFARAHLPSTEIMGLLYATLALDGTIDEFEELVWKRRNI
jgi:hypothetical protein